VQKWPRAIYKGDDLLVQWKKKTAEGGFFFPLYKIAYVGGPRLEVPVALLFGRESVSLPVNPVRFARALLLQQ